jgi:phenylacetate-CoA ligase
VYRGLGSKIIDRYSCEETGYIALQCPRHNHLHVISPVTILEIIDESGNPCPPGKPGRVLVTGMQSFAMPLIR